MFIFLRSFSHISRENHVRKWSKFSRENHVSTHVKIFNRVYIGKINLPGQISDKSIGKYSGNLRTRKMWYFGVNMILCDVTSSQITS